MSALEEFQRQGYLAPVRVFAPGEARQWLRRLKACPQASGWSKSRAIDSLAFTEVAHHPRIIDTVKSLIGDNILLWGASLVRRRAGESHPWHSDIETAYSDGNTVSVWLALSNVSAKSGLRLISGSHLVDASVQQLRYLDSVERAETNSRQVLAWARTYSPGCEIHQPNINVGEAIFFDGRLWHGSVNNDPGATRVALLLQYACPKVPIRVCESPYLSPYVRLAQSRPQCILVSGCDDYNVNDVVSSPRRKSKILQSKPKPFVSCLVQELDRPLPEDLDAGRRSFQVGGGVTPTVDRMNCHMTVLSPGHMPHEPHRHLDEELLVMLSGEADLVMVPEQISARRERYRLKAGSLVYYPAFYTHSIDNTGTEPASYLMFKWRAAVPSRAEAQASVYRYDIPELSVDNRHNKQWQSQKIFSFPTRHLKTLHCHVSLLQPGAGYKPHRDRYDVAIVLLSGTVETLGRQIEPFGVAYYSAGELHGLRNIGKTPAYYLVFEFHPSPANNQWLRNGLQIRRILKSPLRQIPRNIGVFTALRCHSVAKRYWH